MPACQADIGSEEYGTAVNADISLIGFLSFQIPGGEVQLQTDQNAALAVQAAVGAGCRRGVGGERGSLLHGAGILGKYGCLRGAAAPYVFRCKGCMNRPSRNPQGKVAYIIFYCYFYRILCGISSADSNTDIFFCHKFPILIGIDAKCRLRPGNGPFAEHAHSPGGIHGAAVQLRGTGPALEGDVMEIGMPLSDHGCVVGGPAPRGRPGAHAGIVMSQLQEIKDIHSPGKFEKLHGQSVVSNDTAGFDIAVLEGRADGLLVRGEGACIVDVRFPDGAINLLCRLEVICPGELVLCVAGCRGRGILSHTGRFAGLGIEQTSQTCIGNDIGRLLTGGVSRSPVQFCQAQDDMQAFPAGFGALIIFYPVQGTVNVISGALIGQILLDFQCKVQIALLSGKAVEQGEDVDG